jgi:hypothetical protein
LLTLSIDELIAGNFSNIDTNLTRMFSLLDELNSRNILDFINHFCTLFKTMFTVNFIHNNNKIMVFFFLYSIKEEVMKLHNLMPFILKNIIAFFINDDLKYLTKKINELLTSTQKDSPQEEIHDMLIYYQQNIRYNKRNNVKYKKDMKFIDDIITIIVGIIVFLSIVNTMPLLRLIYISFRKNILKEENYNLMYETFYKENFKMEIKKLSMGIIKQLLIAILIILNVIF